MPEVPEARAMVPLSPYLASTDEMIVPSGMVLTGMILPTWRVAFFASVHKHAGVHTFDGDEILSAVLVFILVSEDNLSEGCASSRVVNDVLDNSLDVSLSLNEVECSEFGGGHSLVSVSFKDTAASVSLGPDASSHD